MFLLVFVNTSSYNFCSQEGSQRRTHVSREDTAVTPMLFVELVRKTSSPASVPLASGEMAAYVMVRIAYATKKDFIVCISKKGVAASSLPY